MAEQLINTGDIINQDVSPLSSKTLYNSTNFRVTTNDGNTFTARVNVKGTAYAIALPGTPYKLQISFSNLNYLVVGSIYSLVFEVDTIQTTFNFTFTNAEILATDLATFIKNDTLLFGNCEAQSLGEVVYIFAPFDLITISSFTLIQGTQAVLPVPLYNGTFTLNYILANAEPDWQYNVAVPLRWSFQTNNGVSPTGLARYFNNIATTSYIEQTVKETLVTGDYTVNIKCMTVQSSTNFTMNVYLGGILIHTEALTSNTNYINTPLTIPCSIVPVDNQIKIELVTTGGGINAIIFFDEVNITKTVELNYKDIFTFTTLISSITDLKIIGWTTLRDDLYLLSTNGTFNPDVSETTSYGQWWKLSYNKAGNYADSSIYNLKCIYNDLLNLTVYRPVANPGMIISRYETETIQKIYWCDNYNNDRVINVADQNVFFKTPEQLSLLSILNFSEPRVKSVLQSGNLLEGCYNACYRLTKVSGGETTFSQISNPFYITKENEEQSNIFGNFPNFGGSVAQDKYSIVDSYGGSKDTIDVRTNKSLLYTIDNIDTNYDYVELCIIYRNKKTDIPTTISIVRREPITSSEIDLIYTGEEIVTSITLDELNSIRTSIKKSKTMNTKNNYLFLGNVELENKILDFDTRAYRFPKSSNETVIKDGNNHYYTLNDSFNITKIDGVAQSINQVPETHDAIQDYNAQAPTDWNNYLYKPNSTILGGEGLNISYRFLTFQDLIDQNMLVTLDDTTSIHPLITNLAGIAGNNPAATSVAGNSFFPPYKNVNKQNIIYDVANLGKEYYNANTWTGYMSSYIASLLKGYRRDEVYSFAFQGFDKKNNPYFASWIADIRMPHIYMPDTASANSKDRSLQFEVAKYQNDILYAFPIAIEFTVNTASIDDRLSSWQIVRCERRQENKRVLHQGVFNPFTIDTTGKFYTLSGESWGNDISTSGGRSRTGRAMNYHSPELMFQNKLFLSNNDKFDVVGLMKDTAQFMVSVDFAHNYVTGLPAAFYPVCVKNYEYHDNAGSNIPQSIRNPSSNNPYTIGDSLLITENLKLRATSDIFLGNNTQNSAPETPNIKEMGNRCAYIAINTTNGNSDYGDEVAGDLEFEMLDGWESVDVDPTPLPIDIRNYAYVANCITDLTNQYGGNTYAQRASREYIKCSPVLSGSTVINVFSGDTYITVFDYVAKFANYSGIDEAGDRGSLYRLIPIESDINIDLRSGYAESDYAGLLNKEWMRATDSDGSAEHLFESGKGLKHIDTYEEFAYNYVYSNENDIRKFFPKPPSYVDNTKFDVRIYKTEIKHNGELADSWTDIKENAWLELDSSFGSLNSLILFQDKMYFLQDRGFGLLQIGDRQIISEEGQAELTIGSSGILENFDYISTKTGSKHAFSISVSDYVMLWFDTLSRKLYRFNPKGLEPISDIKGMSAFVFNNTGGEIQSTDNPYIGKGIHSTYDYRHNEFLITFLNDTDDFKYTLVYNELLDGFIGDYQFNDLDNFNATTVYINDKLNIFSTALKNGLQTLYIHDVGPYCMFYDNNPLPSILSFITNDQPSNEKVLLNLEVISEAYKLNTLERKYNSLSQLKNDIFFNTLRTYNTYQNTNFQNLDTLSRKHKTIWNVKIPTDMVKTVNENIFDDNNLELVKPKFTRRLKDKWFITDLIYNNTDKEDQTNPISLRNMNYKFVVNLIKSIFNINSR